jgi:hypothetical protein
MTTSLEPATHLHVLYDRSGRILAAVQIDDRSREGVPLPRPVAQRGQFTADVQIPSEAAQQDLVSICDKYFVRGRGERASLVAGKGKRKTRSFRTPARKSARSARREPRKRSK